MKIRFILPMGLLVCTIALLSCGGSIDIQNTSNSSGNNTADNGTPTVTPVTLTSLAITPVAAVLPSGSTRQFTAVGTFSDMSTQNLTSAATWTTQDVTTVGISAAGLASGAGLGSATISASYSGLSGSASAKVVPGFSQASNYPTSPAAIRLSDTVVGDLNGDGRKDIAAIEAFSGSRILVFYQNAAGAFDPSLVVLTDMQLRGIKVGDINNDGIVDLIVSGNSTTVVSGPWGRIATLSQDPVSHALGLPNYYTLSSEKVGPLAVADLNNDGTMDVVAAGRDASAKGLVSLLFQSGGMLTSEVTYTSVPVAADREVHVADMNHDGKNDIILQSNTSQLAVIKQTGPGIFSTTPDFYATQTSSSTFRSFSVGDLNNDGLADIVVADTGNDGSLNIFLQNSGGTMTGPILRTLVYNTQDEVDIADMDSDGLNDILVMCCGNTVYVLYQAADHSFLGPIIHYLPTDIWGGTADHQTMAVEDINGDGLPDIEKSWWNEGIYVLPRKP